MNISFTSNIKFVTRAEFNRTQKEIGEKNRVSEKLSSLSGTSDKIFSERAYYCTMGGVNNTKKCTLMHYAPDTLLENLSNAKLKLDNELEKYRKKDFSGIITGGYVEGISFVSMGAFLKFKEMLSSATGNISTFWGQKDGYVDLAYTSKDDTWHICKEKGVFGEGQAITAYEIKDSFDYINISDRDKVLVMDKQSGKYKEAKKSLLNTGDNPLKEYKQEIAEFIDLMPQNAQNIDFNI